MQGIRTGLGRGGALGVLMLALALLAAMAWSANARAAFGDGFEIVDVNVEDAQDAPAFPGDQAFWAGTCDLGALDAEVGTAPALAPDCIDLGTANAADTEDPWFAVPSWRLAPVTQAGAHPDATTTLMLRRAPTSSFGPDVDGSVRDVILDLPPGLTGNPTAVPQCPALALRTVPPQCPPETQVGIATNTVLGALFATERLPVYNVEPRKGKTAEFLIPSAGYNFTNIPIVASVRTGTDRGITTSVPAIPPAAPMHGTQITLWGTPWAETHDPFRPGANSAYVGNCVGSLQPPFNFFTQCGIPATGLASADQAHYQPDWGSIKPFLSNPTRCAEPPETTLHIDSWQNPGKKKADGSPDLSDSDWQTYKADAPAVTGCDDVPFEASLRGSAESRQADSPTGATFDLEVPQSELSTALATAHLEDAIVELPEGLTVSPSAADGLEGCTLEQANLHSTADSDCPGASKIGTVRVDTPLLPDPMKGSVYLAQPHDNPFDSLLALYMVIRGPGLVLKLPGEVTPDPDTGQLTASFTDQPQLPFSKLSLKFKDGPRAPLASPRTCGEKVFHTTLTSWSGKTVTSDSSFVTDRGASGHDCVDNLADRPFEPAMKAGVVNPVAGSSSPFILRIARADGDQEVDRLTVNPPEGVAAVLRNAEQCSDGDIAANDCPEASRVGKAIVGAGPGSNPFYVDGGEVFFAGPYDPDGNGPRPEAPLSLDIQVPAVAGPFDLGIVNVRSAIYVDPQTAQLTIESDPLPQILEGIPLRVRDIRVRVDKPGFMVAPTDCDPKSVGATVFGIDGAEAELSNRFQVGDCAALGFDPKLRLKYRGKGSKRRNSHPRLTARLTVPQAEENFDSDVANDDAGARQANLARVRAVLPRGTFLDQNSLSRVCTPTQWEAEDCPSDSRVGSAKAWSPLLAEPLKGPVYLKVGPNELPDLAADLNGIVDIDLFGKIDQSKGRIRNIFQVVPDVPVSRFDLNIAGGKGGLLVNSRDICKGKKRLRRANVRLTGQNQDWRSGPQMVTNCKRRGKRAGGKRKGAAGKRAGRGSAKRDAGVAPRR